MGQVPSEMTQILIIGDGRLATALRHHHDDLSAAKAPVRTSIVEQWSRKSPTPLSETLARFDATHVWLAIADGALESFVREHATFLESRSTGESRIVVHFAGSMPDFSFVHCAHPLTTFAGGAADLSGVPFVLDRGGCELKKLMPGFDNPVYRINPADRAYYHALCAIAGNFTTLLWETVGRRFEERLELPEDALTVYRNRIFENLRLATGRSSALTGPLARGDFATIQKHRDSLLGHYEIPLLKIYDGFVDLYRTLNADARKEHA